MTDSPFEFPTDHQPRRGRLLTSGIVLGLIGCLVGLLSAFYLAIEHVLPTGALAQAGGGDTEFFAISMRIAGFIFGVVALVFLVTAYGSIFLRRWARPFALFLSATWLYLGFVYLLWMLVFMGPMQRDLIEQMESTVPPGATAGAAAGPGTDAFLGIFMIVGVLLITVFGIMLPGLVLWLNWHRDVRMTLEFCDRKPRWTDPCPVPVLGLVLAAIGAALMTLPSALLGWFPVFGRVYTGLAAQAGFAITGVLLLAIAWGAYRRKMIAWMLALAFLVLAGVSGLMTTLLVDYRELYASMGMSEVLIDQSVRSMELMQDSPGAIAMIIASFLPPLGYLIWLFRHFRTPDEAAGTPSPAA